MPSLSKDKKLTWFVVIMNILRKINNITQQDNRRNVAQCNIKKCHFCFSLLSDKHFLRAVIVNELIHSQVIQELVIENKGIKNCLNNQVQFIFFSGYRALLKQDQELPQGGKILGRGRGWRIINCHYKKTESLENAILEL